MSRYIDADKYMNHLRANINTTSDIIAEQIKKDEPIGTVADGGQIGYLNALQWARASLECDYYAVKAISLDKVKKAREEIEEKAFTEEILDEDIFNSTNTESVSRETAECESCVETEVVRLSRNFAIDYLLGEDWYVVDPLGQTQINEIALYCILEKYSAKFKKEKRNYEKQRNKNFRKI